MVLLRERGATLHEIGRAVGRDHSTVVYGLRAWGLVRDPRALDAMDRCRSGLVARDLRRSATGSA